MTIDTNASNWRHRRSAKKLLHVAVLIRYWGGSAPSEMVAAWGRGAPVYLVRAKTATTTAAKESIHVIRLDARFPLLS